LKKPVWIGPDIKIGYEKNTGQFVSDDSETPNDGLLYTGISLPIGRGILIDERRAALKQALQMEI
jgi:hypothetical protein